MSFSERDLQSKLDEMEADIDRDTSKSQDTSQSIFPQLDISASPKMRGWIEQSKAWFNSLPKIGKAAVAIAGVWLGFSIVGAVLHVISSVLTISVVGFILYIGYRLFNSSEAN